MVTPYPPCTNEILALIDFVTTWDAWEVGNFKVLTRHVPNRAARYSHIDNMHLYAKHLKETGFTGDSHEDK